MSDAEEFLDSNVVLYLISTEREKARRVRALLEAAPIISVQVLNEFANVAYRKKGLAILEIRDTLRLLRDICRVVPLTIETHELGLDLVERYGFSVYDAMIVAAALRAGCRTLHTEDMHEGLHIDRLTIRNPFRALEGPA